MIVDAIPDLRTTARVIHQIKGFDVQRGITEVARVGGRRINPTELQTERYAINRLALSPFDKAVRENVIKPRMQHAGMEAHNFPLGLLGIKRGLDPTLAPVLILSHTDSVPDGDMYDGVLGVVGGIETVRAINSTRTPHRRTIMVLSLTGEESAAFGFALFGSKSMFEGLTDSELLSKNAKGIPLWEMFDGRLSTVKLPIFGPKGDIIDTPFVGLELHVEQGLELEQAGVDIGIVEAIAAPIRHKVVVGNTPIEPDNNVYSHTKYLHLRVAGTANHSGATPMGDQYRADGLVQTAKILKEIAENRSFAIGGIAIEGQALNKIPGVVDSLIRITGESEAEIEEAISKLRNRLEEVGGKIPMSLNPIEGALDIKFFNPDQMLPRQMAALSLIEKVNSVANLHAEESVVGTVGTYKITPEGKIELGLDLRGINKITRDRALVEIMEATRMWENIGLNFGERMPGSGDPVSMDSDLVNVTAELIGRFGIGSFRRMVSKAGHDIQNVARQDIPSIMLFAQSHKGIAHNPDAYTPVDNIEKVVRAFAALTLRLAA